MRHKSFLLQVVAAAALAWCLSCERSAAEVQVSGTQQSLILQVQDATVPEILSAVRDALDIEVTLTGGTEKKYTGTYSGSLRKVLAHLLAGQNYIVRIAAGGMSLRLLGAGGAESVFARSDAPAATQGSRLVGLRQGSIKRTSD